jgi:hypothetical protein
VAVISALLVLGAVVSWGVPVSAATSTTLPPKGTGVVHVTVRGSRNLVLDGTAVECQAGGGTTNVGLDAADYPQLGKRGYLVVLVPLAAQFTPAVRARIGGTKFSTLGAQDQASWKVSGRRVTFSKVDADGGRSGIRVSGTVICP